MRVLIGAALLAAFTSASKYQTSYSRAFVMTPDGLRFNSDCGSQPNLEVDQVEGRLDQFLAQIEWGTWCACSDPQLETEICQNNSPYYALMGQTPALENLAMSKSPHLARLIEQHKQAIQDGVSRKGQAPLQMWDYTDNTPWPPNKKCLDWTKYEASKCDQRWYEWRRYCWEEWTDMCEKVDQKWYGQDLDWQEPDWISQECFKFVGRTEECELQWDRLYSQCWKTGDYADTPYNWSKTCDLTLVESDFWNIYYNTIGGDLVLLASPAVAEAEASTSWGKILGSATAALAFVGIAAVGINKFRKSKGKASAEEALL